MTWYPYTMDQQAASVNLFNFGLTLDLVTFIVDRKLFIFGLEILKVSVAIDFIC